MNVVNSKRHVQKNSCRYHHRGILHEKLETQSYWLLRGHGKRNPDATQICSVLWEEHWLSSKWWERKPGVLQEQLKEGASPEPWREQGNMSSTWEKLQWAHGWNCSPHQPASGVKGKLGQLMVTTHSDWWDLCIGAVPLHSFLRGKNSSLFCHRSFVCRSCQWKHLCAGSGHWITLSPVQMGVLSLF